MPRPAWELATNAAFYGYLKFLDFQANGRDLHVTFEKNPKKAHVSVYELGGKKRAGQSFTMSVGANGLYLETMDWFIVAVAVGCASTGLPNVTGYTSYQEFFNFEVNLKAFELGIVPQKPANLPINQQPKIGASDFPGLS